MYAWSTLVAKEMNSDFRILGELEVRQDGQPVDLGSPRQRALLARLLVSAGEAVSTDRLIDDLWNEADPHKAKRTLQVYVSRLRQALGDDGALLEQCGTGYRLATEGDSVDAARFESLAEEGQLALSSGDAEAARSLLRTALDLWRGPPLAEFPDDAFACVEVARLTEARISAEEARIWADLRLGHHTTAAPELNDLVAWYPFRETFWEQLMLALYRSGRQAEALRTYQTARSCLVEELGLEPGSGLRTMERRILSQDPTLDLAASDGAAQDLGQLPSYLTSFIGREEELERASVLLRQGRLLTITGAPGVGKTRFALEVARSLADRFEHRVYFVPLAPVSNPRLVDRAIAQSLRLVETQGRPVADSVKAFFRHRGALLILDNFEQILSAAPQVGELLGAASDLTIVITSRSPLQISGEQRFPLPPLRVPSIAEDPDPLVLADFDAVKLFRARARASYPTFDPDPEALTIVAEIVARLDGLPLAIELAASRSDVLTLEELRSLLARRVLALDGAALDVGSRHRTMRDAISWSIELLEPEDRAFFRRLGVFEGGFTIEAAGAVAEIGSERTREAIESLVARSLVSRVCDSGVSRFALLELIREFARSELDSAGGDQRVAGMHARYYREFVGELEPLLTTMSGEEASTRIDAEVDNLRAALLFALNETDPDLGLQTASCLWRYWQSTGRLVEGREWLESLLAIPGASDAIRANGLMALAGVAYWQGDYEKAMATYREALGLYLSLDDPLNVAEVLFSMSATANFQDDVEIAEECALEARRLFEEVGSTEGIGRVLVAEGFSRWKRGDYPEALEKYEKAGSIARASGDDFMAMTAAIGVAALSFLLGDTHRALGVGIEALAEASAVHNEHLAVWILDLTAAFCVREAPEDSVQLAGAADSLRREAGGGMVIDSFDIEPARAAAASLLSDDILQGAWVKGASMTLEDAVILARHLADCGLDEEAPR
jgi:predicted ATPase/DNA-binding SARP family transcriptional activator